MIDPIVTNCMNQTLLIVVNISNKKAAVTPPAKPSSRRETSRRGFEKRRADCPIGRVEAGGVRL